MASPELEAKIKQVKEKYGEKKPESFDQQVERVKQKYSPIGRLKQMRKTMSDHLKKEHIGFKKLENKVESEGYSEESAKKIAAAVGRKKYGKKGMEEKAKAGMHKAEEHLEKCASCGGPMRKSEDDAATHSHKGIRLQHMKDLGDGHHAFKILDGHHAGKWTKLHESEAEPVQKAAPHLEKHVEGVSDEKFDRCVDHVKHQGGKYNAYAVCTASLKKMRQYAAKDKMEKGGENGTDAVGGMRKMKAALHKEKTNGSESMGKAEVDEFTRRKADKILDKRPYSEPDYVRAARNPKTVVENEGRKAKTKEKPATVIQLGKSKEDLEKSKEWEVPGEVP